jgi:putative permease
MNPKIIYPFYARLTYVLLACICLAYIFVVGKQILCPLIFSFLFAILLLPAANFLEQKCYLPRAVAAILCVVFFIAAVVGIVYLLGT